MSKPPLCLLAVAVIGCAAPSGKITHSRMGGDSHPRPVANSVGGDSYPRPVDAAALPAATSRVFDARRDDMQFELAEQRWRRNELTACRQMLEELLARNAAHRQANLRLAELYLSQGQPSLAQPLLQRFCRAHRDDAEAHHLLGVAYEATGQSDRALAAYDAATTLDPSDPLVRGSLENALAARDRESPAPTPRHAAKGPALIVSSPLKPSAADEVVESAPDDKATDESPPRRAPRAGATATAEREPQRLDQEIMTALRTKTIVPEREAVSTSAATATASDADAEAETPSTRGAAAPPSATADSAAPDTDARGESPVRWAYELEIGDSRSAPAPSEESEQARPDEPRLEPANAPVNVGGESSPRPVAPPKATPRQR